MSKYDSLKLENQICFPLYAASKEVVRQYKPFLDEIDLTYTQYIVMMVMWEKKNVSVKSLGECLYLDSGTLTPVLKSLEKKGYLKRARSEKDERVLNVTVSDLGMGLRDKALSVPSKIASCVHLDKQDALDLYRLLHKVLSGIKNSDR